jgi:beta-galactosidase
MRKIYPFGDDWLFAPKLLDFGEPDRLFEPVTLPHTNRLFTHRTVYENEYQFESTYRKRFIPPEKLDGQRAFLDFEGAMLVSRVYLNDELVGQHAGGYTPFSVELTQQLHEGANTLHVLLDSRELAAIPPNGHRLDFLSFGGIYREVNLRLVDDIHIESAFAHPHDVLNGPRLTVDVRLSQFAGGLRLVGNLKDREGKSVSTNENKIDSANAALEFSEEQGVELWSIENPVLYTLDLRLLQAEKTIDQIELRIGFRQAEFKRDGKFYLNGKQLKLLGLNRHQTYPFIGMAAPARLQRQDADILKHELGCNIVRTSHYPQSPNFLDRCDEIGLLVLEEIPGWQHIGDEQWQELLLAQLREMIIRDRNHPSIILWGVRINESPDNDPLYRHTNRLARELDPTRQTGGIRNFMDSSFLEDVFTFNDFSLGVTEPKYSPHLITEFAGHVYPTKTWDNEDRLIEHALIHARKHNLQLGRDDIAGAIGWCAFDYNTHLEFGSGDRICHHGVMDIFRLPKWAAYFYRSQKTPDQELVLKAATYWTFGDRSGGGNNPLIVFSNCDEIEVFIGREKFGRFQPDREQFANLPHPPFTVRWPLPYNPWGAPSGDLKIIGYRNGQPVIQQEIAADQQPHKLSLRADSQELKADGADMTRVIVSVDDRFGNPVPYQARVIQVDLEGEAQYIGENPLILLSGPAACLVRAGKRAGLATVTARTAGLEEQAITIQLID